MGNSRFKFRIWDKESQKYHNGMEVFDYMRGVLSPDKYIMEQSTGLKDKNGKLIYEGDELKDWKNNRFVIAFDEQYAQFVAKDENDWVSPIERDILDDCEIIGNIHTNADLLGEE